MNRSLAMLFACAALAAAQDSRNTNVPNTDTHFTMPEYKTVAEWEARKTQLRAQILWAAGLLPMPDKAPLNPRVAKRIEHQDYTIESVALETMPGFYLGGNLYRPKGRSGKFPAVMIPHGHWTYGRLENSENCSTPEEGINMARQGYVVFAYDMVGYNDTDQTPHEFEGKPERLWGFSPFGLQTWNSIRVLDYLSSLPDVDAKRIGITGASGGGTQTFILAAVDDRIAFSAPVNMVSAIMQGGCVCENAPGLRIGTSNLEIAAMMAPKPMLAVAATGDWTKNVPREEFPEIQRVWARYGRPNDVATVQFNSPHNYHKDSREAVYAFFGKKVLDLPQPPKEKEADVEKLQDMLVFCGRPKPANAIGYDKLFEQWKRISRRQLQATTDPEALRQRLRLAFAAEWPSQVEMAAGALTRPGKGDHVPAQWTAGQGTPVLYLHPDGAEAARKSPEVAKLLAAKRPLLLIDAFQTGSAKAPRDRSHRHFLTFNVTDDAARVQDVLTAVRYLQSTGAKKVEIAGEGDALVWGLFAAAIAPNGVQLAALPAGFQGSDKDFIDRFFVPGIQRAGGLEAAMRLTRGKH